jgi:hypothetical protein
MHPKKLDWSRLRVFPLEQRRSLTRAEEILVSPDADPKPIAPEQQRAVDLCARQILAARASGSGVILMYGAHLLRNGAALILHRMMQRGWLTHLATNGAGTIHDWEYAWLGRSTESVEQYVAAGSFGAWDETGRNIHLALLAGALRGDGYGVSLGRFIAENGVDFPSRDSLVEAIRANPADPLTAARADLLQAIDLYAAPQGRYTVQHRWPQASILAAAYSNAVPMTVHPGVGYDIIANHPIFNGAVIGRAAGLDFRLFGDSVETLDNGVVLSVGSAIMAPQVFEKSLSSVNNLRLQDGRPTVSNLTIHVVDLQDGGNWDWTTGEPPKTNPAYYLRFCKSFSRMGGAMHYTQCDNLAFIQNVYHSLCAQSGA